MSMKQPKEKRRNNEKRKEKSRDAARCRRTRETQIFTELAETLPVRREDADQLDKASVMRLAISYLRARDVVNMLPEIKVEDQPEQESVDSTTMENPDVSYLEALDGFVFVISSQGDIVYLSENIADYLGVSQIEMVGQSVFEFSHPCDHDELRDVLRAKPKNRSESGPSSFFLRLKCTLTSKGRSVNLKSASYKVIHFTGHVLFTAEGQDTKPNNLDVNQNKSEVIMDETDKKLDENTNDEKCDDPPVKIVKSQGSLIAIGRPIPHPSNIEIPLSNTFLSKHNLDMKFTYADESMLSTLGYEPQDLTGKSLFEYHYTVDSRALAQNFKCLFSKGQCETGRYRFLAKRGGYAWVQTQATVIYDKQQRPVSVVCVNYVISGVESADEVLSGSQLRWRADVKPAAPANGAPANGAPVAIVSERPRPATAQIFAPRTKDMNKGFLMFSEEDPGLTMLKEEPEDLTHLAPTAGDACIPLEDNPFDVFDAFILDDNYCDLLEHTASPDSLLLSEPDVQESNSSCSQTTPSLCSETSLEASAPYIPMVGGDELPLLAPAELVMWGALPDHVSLHRPAPALGLHPQDILDNIYPEQGELATWRPMTEEPLGARDAARGAMRDAARDVMRDAKRDAAREAARESGKRGAPPEGEQQAKRARAAPADSVLMNLLDGGPPKTTSDNIVNRTSAIIINKLPFRLDSAKAPLKCDTNESDINMQCPMSIPSNLLSPLSLNLSNPASPYYQPSLSSHSSPGYTDCSPRSFPSPLSIISPLATKVQGYAYDKGTALLSPGGVLRSDLDPLLTHTVPDDQIQNKRETLYKMDAAVNNLSPGLGSDTKLFDEAVTPMMTDLNVWMETDQLLNDTGNILSGFDV